MENTTLVIAAATVGYFIITIFMFLNMSKTLREYRNQVTLLKTQMMLTFRPQLDLRIIAWRFNKPRADDKDVKCKIEVDARNSGRAPIQIHNPHLCLSFNIGIQDKESWGSSSDLLKHKLMNFEVSQNGKLTFPIAIPLTIFDMVTKVAFKPYCTAEINMETSWELEPTPKMFTRTFYLTLEQINEEHGEANFSYRAIESTQLITSKDDFNEYIRRIMDARAKYGKDEAV